LGGCCIVQSYFNAICVIGTTTKVYNQYHEPTTSMINNILAKLKIQKYS